MTHEKDSMASAFEMGQQSASYRVESLERRERAVEAAEARLREKAIVLGVAEWMLARDDRGCATVCTFRIDDVELKEGRDVYDIIDAGRKTAKWV